MQHTDSTAATIKLGIAVGRSAPTRFLEINRGALTPRQIHIAEQMLPVHPKTGAVLLKSPGSKPRSLECFIKLGEDGEFLEPIDFKFEVPDQACNDDAAALLDKWDQTLQATRAKMERKIVKNGGVLKKPRAKKAQEIESSPPADANSGADTGQQTLPSSIDQGGEDDSACEGATDHAEEANIDAANAELSDIACGADDCRGHYSDSAEALQLRPASERSEGDRQGPGSLEPRVGDYLIEVYTKLPLLTEFMVEELPGPDTITLPDKSVWQSLIRITRFDMGGWTYTSVDQALDQHYGKDWADSERVEDIGFRLEQARELLISTWTQYKEVLSSPRKGSKESKSTTSADHIQRLPATMDLVRQMRVDLSSALNLMSRAYPRLAEHPDWVGQVVEGIGKCEPKLRDMDSITTLSETKELYEAWAANLSKVKPTNQVSLFAVGNEKGIQRTAEHMVRRARNWAELIQSDLPLAIAALALVEIIC